MYYVLCNVEFLTVKIVILMEFTTEALINCVQSENVIWDSMLNVDEGTKELAWRRIADNFGISSG